MSDWNERVKAAELDAEQVEAAEHAAEASFRAVQGDARAQGAEQDALHSEEFRNWMAKRRATDEAWGKWATLMDEKHAS